MINRILIIFIIGGLLISCGAEKKEYTDSNTAPGTLVGTWQLKKRINHRDNETEWTDVSDTILYHKHLTATHFTWLQYHKNNDVLLGIGGGKYDYDGSAYIERIEFFKPLFAGILGQSINFTADFKDGEWYHNGYIKEIEFDPELAEMVEVDSNRVEEIWYKIENGGSDMTGTWELLELKEQPDASYFSFPDFINYVKLITPTHFIWIQYNDEGDEVSGAGSGTYTYDGKEYREQIQMMYPAGNPVVGGEHFLSMILMRREYGITSVPQL